jgi:hypothetical protein
MDTYLLQPCVGLRWDRIDMFVSDVFLFVSARRESLGVPVLKLKSPSIINEGKTTLKPVSLFIAIRWFLQVAPLVL